MTERKNVRLNSRSKFEVAVLDFETDPFSHGVDPKPFAGCLYTPKLGHLTFWGDDCAERIVTVLRTIKTPLLIYAHNGGRFDFFFLYRWLENPLLIINSRIVEAKMGIHTLRDSFAILPVPLASFEKGKIDYAKFTRAKREKHKAEILEYLESDCNNLYVLVDRFVSEFGPQITIGATAMRELQKEHPQRFERDPVAAEEHDNTFRQFYYGGRVETFAGGIHRGKWKVYDVNSMYPGVMMNYKHPHGLKYVEPENIGFTSEGLLRGFPTSVWFIEFEGTATHLPWKDDKGSLFFSHRTGVFSVTSHEFQVAYSNGFVKVDRVVKVLVGIGGQYFKEFVTKRMENKLAAEKRGDKAGRLFEKLLANSAYGKFATNPRKFKEYHIETLGEWNHPEGDGWAPVEINALYRLWARPVPTESGWRDVAVAASITGAARAELLRALLGAKRAMYCDTDSIICEGLDSSVVQHESEVGAWKTEADGDELAIGGKKLYALFKKGVEVKSASKGAILSGAEVRRVARGEVIEYKRAAPSYDIAGNAKFLTRNIRSTVDSAGKRVQNTKVATSRRKRRI